MERLAFNIGERFFNNSNHFLSKPEGVGQLVSIGIGDAIIFAGIVLIFMIIISGYNMMSGSGDPGKQKQAQQILTYAIIGFILVVAAYFIAGIVELSTGMEIL